MTEVDKATGAYEPFVQIPPGLDCRGVCPTIEMSATWRLLVPAVSEWIAMHQAIDKLERRAQAAHK